VRLLELRLLAYGSFTDRKLDFSRGAPALHLIYGPNEAGKSTALRAILGLLYGIEERTSDDYVHAKPNLRIAGRLRDSTGHELSVTRRKGKKDTLLGQDGKPLDEALLSRMLGGIPEAVFRSMFGLDHERLRLGGEQLRLGQGDLGESLFQAGVGARGIHQALELLDQETETLFLARGQRALNDSIKRFEEARRRVREHAKRADSFRANEQELEQVAARAVQLQLRRQALLAEQSRWQRALRVLPALAKRREWAARRSALGQVVALGPHAEAERRSAQAALAQSEAQSARLQQSIELLQKRRAELVVVESLVELGPERMHAIRMRLGSHLKAAADLRSQQTKLRVLAEEASGVLRLLGRTETLDRVEALRIDTATQTLIAKLAREQSGLCERVEAARRDLDGARTALERARAELAALSRRSQLALEPAPGVLGLPSEAAVLAFRERFEQLERARASQAETAAKLGEREGRVLLALDTMERQGAPPTEPDLIAARAERDLRWQRLRADLLTGSRPEPELVHGYESERQRSDDLADRLRREATRVSERARLLSEQDEIARERAKLLQRRGELEAGGAVLAAEWRAAWESLGVEPRAPAEMAAIVVRVAGLLEVGNRGRAEAERRGEEAQRALDRWQRQWGELMGRLRLAPDASVEEAQAVLEELRRLFEKVDGMRESKARIDGMERDAVHFERDVRDLIARHLPELQEAGLEQAAEELARRYEKARANLEQRTQLDGDLQAGREQLQALQAERADALRMLESLMRSAHVSDLEALEEAERRGADAQECERRLAEIENELLGAGEGSSIEALIAETTELGPDKIRARLEDIKDELDAVNEEHDAAARQRGGLERGLEVLKRDDQAAEAATEAEQHLSRIKSQAHAYVRKRLAAELLRREIRRYRDANQEPIVAQAALLFARLTLQRYPNLRVDYAENDEPVLVCVDQQERTVKVEALSDGARDQLYLALRLASLRCFAERTEPMPLVLDDVLIHFDDERAAAALSVLGEIAAVTQVLFFTHHARIVELARGAIAADHLVEHRLAEDRATSLRASHPIER
jgi:uncharacterized protein YhaN